MKPEGNSTAGNRARESAWNGSATSHMEVMTEGRLLRDVKHLGMLVRHCTVPGETRADDVYPSHPNAIQVSRNRWLLVYATRGFRGTDDDRSIVYQLRDGTVDGPLVREGLLAQSVDDWNPLNDGKLYVRQFGHPTAFGVPRGALIRGLRSPNANVFVVKWRQVARYCDPKTGLMAHFNQTGVHLEPTTQSVGWVQFRLNECENDIEIIQPPQSLRQRGFETGDAFCDKAVRYMNATMVSPVPFNAECTEWIDIGHFDTSPGFQPQKELVERSSIAALKHRFNPSKGLYEWVEMGPLIRGGLMEACVAPYHGSWLIAARMITSALQRTGGPVAWARTDDPFGEIPELMFPSEPETRAPLSAYSCADGVVRLLTSDGNISPSRNHRDPLYCWDIDPDSGFAASNRLLIFDSVAARVPIRSQSEPSVDMGKIVPHGGGSTQFILHRVRPSSTNDPKRTGLLVSQAEKDVSAIYHARLEYAESLPGQWEFA